MTRRRNALASALTALALPVFALACGGAEPTPAPPPPPPPAPTPEPLASVEAPKPKPSLADLEKKALADALAGLNGQDAKRFASVYADDALISVAGLQEVSGRPAIEANMSEWFDTFKEVKLGFSRVLAKSDTLVIEWVINGKHHGELFGVKGKEQPIGHYGLSVVTMNPDGKVATEHRYGELGAVMTQVAPAGAKAQPRPIPPLPDRPEMAESSPSGPRAAEEDKNVDVAKAVLASLEGGKKEAEFTALLADDVEQDGLLRGGGGVPEMSKGKDGAKKFYKAFTGAFPDAKFETTKTLGVGDYAIVESILHATHKGPLGAIAATKKPIAIHVADVFKIKDGKVARAWTYQNSLELEEQLGLFAAPAAVPASQAMPATPKK